MDFKDYVINEEDFDFFKSLPEDEKLLFIYDLICIDAYGIGSTDAEDEIVIDITLDKAEAFKDFIEQFEIKMRSFIASAINLNVDCNLVFINNSVVINSNNKKEIADSVKDFTTISWGSCRFVPRVPNRKGMTVNRTHHKLQVLQNLWEHVECIAQFMA